MQPPSFQIRQQGDPLPDDESVPKKRRNIVTPWQNIAEFEEVRNLIYGTNSNLNTWKQAIIELKIWANRRRAQCPAAVFATLTMLETKLYEENTHIGEGELQSLYAFALIRFFNFMSSTMQSYNMRSMYATATEMGLASFVVDLRHICAHGTELPELLLLRQTTNYCLNWLYGYYWSVQTQKMVDADTKCLQQRDKVLGRRAEQVEELFNIFDTAFECQLNACITAKDVKGRIRGHRLAKFKNYWKSKSLTNVRETFDAVMADMIALTKFGISQLNLASIFAKGFMKMNFFFTFVENHNIEHELPDILDVVQNLFRFLAVYHIVETVLKQLFDFAENTETSEIERAGAAFWIKQIITGMLVFVTCKKEHFNNSNDDAKTKLDHTALNFGKLTRNVRQTYQSCGVDLKRTIVFGDSFQRPWVWSFNRTFLQKRVKAINEHTAPLLQSLITLIKPKMTANEIEMLKKITTAYLAQNYVDDKSMAIETNLDKVYTVDDICADSTAKKTGDVDIEQESTHQSVGWEPLEEDEYDWTNCPIGRLPWQ